ncbi:MAG: hypothetical protein Q4D17_02420 [Planctomycetia bacterium]|nr:hypothetical protein [Planctomycetia bacterium]
MMKLIFDTFLSALFTMFVCSLLLAADGAMNEDHSSFFHGEKVGREIFCGCSGRLERFDAEGNLVWSYSREIGNMSDVQLLENGNILYADADSVVEITPDCRIVFKFTAEDKRNDSTFTASRLANGNTLIGWNTKNCLIIVDSAGKILKTIPCQFEDFPGSHHNMRMARPTEKGTFLVAHKRKGTIAEYDSDGKVLRVCSVPGKECYGVLSLPNDQILGSFLDALVLFDAAGKEIWRCSISDLAPLPISVMCGLQIRENGNIVVGNYAANHGETHTSCMFEITPDKKVVWYYQNPKAPANFMNVQVLEKNTIR